MDWSDVVPELLTSYFDRAAARLVRMVTDEARRFVAKPEYDDVVEILRWQIVDLLRAASNEAT